MAKKSFERGAVVNTPPSNGNGHTDERVLENNRRFERLVNNVVASRSELFQRLLDPRRDYNFECGYPTYITTYQYRELYERLGIASRVVEVYPKETWQTQPEVYEEEDSDVPTEFELAWDELPKLLRGENSWFQDEEGSPVWEALRRADELSGIGSFGVLLLGLDDGKELQTPLAGFDTDLKPIALKPRKSEEETEDDSEEETPAANYRSGRLTMNFVKRGSLNDVEEESSEGDPNPGSLKADDLDKAGESASEKEEPVSTFEPKHRLLYLRAFDESLVQVTRWETEPRNPRFGLPIEYTITFNDPRSVINQTGVGMIPTTKAVHWSRVIHIADNLGPSEAFGVPRMRPVFNNLQDLLKLYGGSAEMYWRGAFPGISMETHPQLGGDVNLESQKESIKEQMVSYMDGLQRYLALAGMSAKTLAPTVVDPTPQIEVQITAICIKLGIPKRVFMGSERGELASSQDDASWNDRLKERQSGYVTPRIIVPFVDRLIAIGVLPEPKGYSVRWPDLNSMSQQEKATVAVTKTDAMSKYIQGGVEALMVPMDYLTRILGFSEEEAQSIVDSSDKLMEEQELEQQALAEENAKKGLNPDGSPMAPAINPKTGLPESPIPGAPMRGGPPKPVPFGGAKASATPSGKPPAGKKPPFVKNEDVDNAFCATGEGGGVDPSCSPGAGGSKPVPSRDTLIAAHLATQKYEKRSIGGNDVEHTVSVKSKDGEARKVGSISEIDQAVHVNDPSAQAGTKIRVRVVKDAAGKEISRSAKSLAQAKEILAAHRADVKIAKRSQTTNEETTENYDDDQQRCPGGKFSKGVGTHKRGAAAKGARDTGIPPREYADDELNDEPADNVFCSTGEGGGVDPSCSGGGGETWSPSGDEFPSHDSWKELEAEPGMLYHATNVSNLHEIKDSALITHRPSYGTDQSEWPDGSRASRSYFTASPSTAYSFAPGEGKPVLLRIPRTKSFKDERSTGDVYLEGKKIPPSKLEVLTSSGWKRIK